jgi:methylmalonyl-CoA mutase N-terminal domain/subunit
VLGGTQSLHCNGRDEALSLPTEEAARIALRTQQVIASETGVTNTVDPVAGSYTIERMTDQLEADARALLDRIDALGGTLVAIESGYVQREVQDAAYRAQQAIDAGDEILVGVNRFTDDEPPAIETFLLDSDVERDQKARLAAVRASRSASALEAALVRVERAARGSDNLVPPILAAVEAKATVGEISDTMRRVFGEYIAAEAQG